MNDAIIIIMMQCCNDFGVRRFIKCMGEWEAAKDQRLFRLQTTLNIFVWESDLEVTGIKR